MIEFQFTKICLCFPGEVILDLKGHGGTVYKSKFFNSGVVVISAGADGSCRIWSAENGANPVTLKGHQMAICDISIIDVGRNIISVSRWEIDIPTSELLRLG